MTDTGELAVRALDLDDPRQALALVTLLDHYARDPMGGGVGLAADVRAELPARLRQVAGFHGALAWEGGQAIGLINCFAGFSTFKARPLLNVHDIAVRADHRRRGVGEALLAWAERRARELGCCKLTLEVLGNNLAAKRCYQRAGFVPYVLDPAAGAAEFMQRQLD